MASQPLKYVYQWQVDIADGMTNYSVFNSYHGIKYVVLITTKPNSGIFAKVKNGFIKGMDYLCSDYKYMENVEGDGARFLIKTGSTQAMNQLAMNIQDRVIRPVAEWKAAGKPTQPINPDAQEAEDEEELENIINGDNSGHFYPEIPETPETPPTPNKSSVVDNLVDTVKDDPKKGLVWLAIALAVVLVIRKIIKK